MRGSRLGDIIASDRQAKGKKQACLAKEIHVSLATMSAIENSRRLPSVPMLLRIAQALDQPVNRYLTIYLDTQQNSRSLVEAAELANNEGLSGIAIRAASKALKLLANRQNRMEIRHLRGWAFIEIGRALYRKGKIKQALTIWKSTASAARQEHSWWVAARAHYEIGAHRAGEEQWNCALQHFVTGCCYLYLAPTESPELHLRVLRMLVKALKETGQYELAIFANNHLFELAKRTTSAEGKGAEVTAMVNMGLLYDLCNQPQQAVNYLHEALKLYQRYEKTACPKSLPELADIYIKLGTAYRHLDPRQSMHYLHLALDVLDGRRHRPEYGRALAALAQIHLEQGEVEQAQRISAKALGKLWNTPHARDRAAAYRLLGTAKLAMKHYKKAESYLRKSLRALENTPYRRERLRTLRTFIALYKAQAKIDLAMHYLDLVIDEMEEVQPARVRVLDPYIL